MGAYHRNDKEGVQKDLEWVFEILPRLKERERQVAGTLSGGEQQMLATARALMSLSIADRGYVLQTGEIVLSDTAKELKKNEMVQKAYLGIE